MLFKKASLFIYNFFMKSRERFLSACYCQVVDRPPVWVMRQAGRYLPEYMKLKERYSFLEMVKTPDLATEVTLMPLKRFDLDAAIIFSDILVIPEAMGQPYMFADHGIQMAYTLDSQDKMAKLSSADVGEKLQYVGDAIRQTRSVIGKDKALLGFGGAPWTLATYMVEGASSKNFSKIKELAFGSPVVFATLMEKICDALVQYFKMQIDAGVDAIQIFDSWGSLCPADHYWSLSLQWISWIIKALPADFPIILYSKGMGHLYPQLIKTKARIFGLDWTVSMDHIRRELPSQYAIQGNLDPAFLNTTPDIVRRETRALLEKMEPYKGFIFNLGHGIHPQAKIENMQAMINTVIESSRVH